MAITTASHSGRNSFTVNATTADLSGCETLLAAVADKRIVIDSIAINAGASITVTVGEGETTGAVTTALLGPVSLIEGLTWSKRLSRRVIPNCSNRADSRRQRRRCGLHYSYMQGG
jgi:hypothetical protein